MVSLSGTARDVQTVAEDLRVRGYYAPARRLLASVKGKRDNDRVQVMAPRRQIIIIAGSVLRTGAHIR